MRTKLVVAIAVVAVMAGVYLAGYLPQRTERLAAEAQIGQLQEKLAAADARIRGGELLGQVLTVKDVTMRRNYGQALELSSPLFDAVRVEAARTPDGALRDGLNEILANRDSVTAALAKSDGTVVEVLHRSEVRLRRALGYTTPPEPAATR